MPGNSLNQNMEQLIEAREVGRDVVASVSASVLSSVITELVARSQNTTKKNVLVGYGEKLQLEIHRERFRKSKDDEGFESDDESSSSLCCLDQDHLFKLRKKTNYDGASLFVNSDSANSSASSDSDDIEPLPVVQCWIERYSIKDVLFCHTESRFPNTIAWVIKRKSSFDVTSRLGKSGVEHFSTSNNCLNVIVVKCQTCDDFSVLCEQYRELSRRIKLDQYKSITRRKPIVLTCLTDTNVKVSLADIKVTPSNLLKASEVSIPAAKTKSLTDLTKPPVSLNSLLKPEEDTLKKSNSLSNITPNKFNLLQRTDFDGVTHSEISKNKSKIQKEIEGVIMSQVDSMISTPVRRQRCTPSILPDENGHWGLSEENPDSPPKRPERRKYLRKKAVVEEAVPEQQKSKSTFYYPIQGKTSLKQWPDAGANNFLDTERQARKCGEYGQVYSDRRRRARSAGRTVTTPMAYRYIDVNVAPLTNCARRRRNSFDETMQVKLKPVIKTNKKIAQDKYYNEPKKVTFSAYATVQVVD